jgi:hypothetical protein
VADPDPHTWKASWATRARRGRQQHPTVVLGDWGEAEKLTGLLPVEDSSVRLLRSELAFVRGDFDGALAEAEMALIESSAERVHVFIRLADIALYLGDFSEAQRYGRSALDLASTSDASLRARCYGIVAATEYFGGDIPGRRDPISVMPWNSCRACPKPTATA